MNGEGTTTTMSATEWTPMLKPTARLKIEGKLQRLAYMLHRANDEHFCSVGWAELRGCFAFGLWLIGAWESEMPPDHSDEPKLEGEFQKLVHEYNQKYSPDEDEDAPEYDTTDTEDEDDDE